MTFNRTSNPIADISINHSAIIAGIALLLMAIIAPIANFSILQKLIVPNDATATLNNITASEGLLRLGICFFLIVVILDIIVAWALYVFLKPVNKSLSLLTAWFRVVYAAMLGVLLIQLVNVLHLLNRADDLFAISANQLQILVMLSINTFSFGWEFSLIIFGCHLLLVGYLMLKAGYMRKILGILIIVASAGYLIDGFGKLLSPHYNTSLAMFTFFGEVILIFWLFISGRKTQGEN